MQQFSRLLTQQGLDALWVTRPENVRYLTGFSSPKDGTVLVTPDQVLLYTDARYTEQVKEECTVPFHIARFQEVPQHASQFVSGKVVGFEADHLTVSKLQELSELQARELRPTTQLLDDLRKLKSAAEVEKIRKAQQIADEGLRQVLPQLKAGVRELDVALALEMKMRELGAEDRAFDIIVAGGHRSAMPHGTASERMLQEGELVTIDWGARFEGYNSDCTRAFPIGQLDDTLRNLYQQVQTALQLALQKVRPGEMSSNIDKAARDHLDSVGLGEHFVHSVGHGVGLAVHEGPGLRKLTPASEAHNEPLQPGMVITIEPGVYLPGVGGVRLEELVLVTENGHEVLSQAPFADL